MKYDELDLPVDLEPRIAQALGDAIVSAALNPKSPFGMMMREARDAFTASIITFIHADLVTDSGLSEARRVQSEARRYFQMCHWIKDHLDTADAADDLVSDAPTEDYQITTENMNQ